MKNNWPSMQAKHLCYTRKSIAQKLSNKQSDKVICRFDRLKALENLLATHAFDYIVLRVTP